MTKKELAFRQIHLDFHTSEEIYGIGKDFDPLKFAETLGNASVNSVTCFARGHHGWLYYDSKKFPERIHPHLENKNLLPEQIKACHEKDIRVPIYITVQCDHYTAKEHPEWLVVDEKGNPVGTPIYEAGFYRFLCVNSPYRDFLKEQTLEVLEEMPEVDGIFFDIVQVKDCSCKYCREGMVKEGLEPSCKEDRIKYAKKMLGQFEKEMTEFVHQYSPDATVFYNSGHVGPRHREAKEAYTHFELESLPSGGWGYMHFPIAMRYARNLGRDCLGMTGKFHTSWGDFHSFKNREALEFECFQMLALNGKCSIGDQLEPDGKLSKPVYDLIGSVYSRVEEKEPWCQKAKAISEIGVLTPEEFIMQGNIDYERLHPSIIGISRMLQEAGHQFDIVDSKSDLSKYRLIVLPDEIPVNKDFARNLQEYLADGGAVIASFRSGLNEDGQFALDKFGVELKETQTTDREGEYVSGKSYPHNDYVDYIFPEDLIAKELPVTEHAMYMKGLEVEAREGTQVLAKVMASYFNRNYRHFCSHRQAPSSGKRDYDGIVRNGNLIYFAHPIFKQYNENAPHWCKQLFLNAVEILMPDQVVKHEGPSTLLVTLNEQKEENRQVLHLLHYIPERRSQSIDIIEDVIPLYNVQLSVKEDQEVKQVRCVPAGNEIEFDIVDDRIEFTVPEVRGHQMIEINF